MKEIIVKMDRVNEKYAMMKEEPTSKQDAEQENLTGRSE